MGRKHVGVGLLLTSAVLAALVIAGPSATAEGPTTASGQLEVLHEDRLSEGRSVHRYRLLGADGARTELLFDDRGPEGLGGRDVRVTGTKVRPGVLRVGSSTAVAEQAGGPTEAPAAVTASLTKRVAVILMSFRDSEPAERSVDSATARQAIFTSGSATPSVNVFLAETSFSKFAMVGAGGGEGDVFDWVTIGASKNDACDFDAWGQQARAAATGFVDANYDQVVHVMPISTCTFGGVAYMPGKYSWTVLNSSTDAGVVFRRLRGITAHEYGHSLGIHHAGSYRCTANGSAVSLSTSCTLAEYGDPFSVMGSSVGERQYHAYQKGRLSWLDAAATNTITSSGTYPLASVSAVRGSDPLVQVLRIARPRSKGAAADFYYVELRSATGAFDNFPTASPVTTGLSIRLAPDYGSNAISKLLDMTPATADFADAALQPTKVFRDTAAGIDISLLSLVDGVASVKVTLPSTRARGNK